MNTFLVIWDYGSGGEQILEKANALATHHNADIRVAAFLSKTYQQETGNTDAKVLKATIDDAILKLNSTINLSVEVITCDDIAGWVTQEADRNSFNLVIKTSHGTETVFYTPTDWKLIRQLKCPVLIGSPKKRKSKSCTLATVDISSNNEQQQRINDEVLLSAQTWATLSDSHLHVAYIIPIARALEELSIVEADEAMRKKGEKAKQKLQALLQKHNIKPAAIHIKAGDPSSEIPRIANKTKAELVVMGSIGRKGVKGLLLGNTAEKVIHNLRTYLLVIKP